MEEKKFKTLKGYDLEEEREITYAMEDYLEMIYRHCEKEGFIRIGELSRLLHVQPSSASKMVSNMKMVSLVEFEKYGLVVLTEKGNLLGEYLLFRHRVLSDFFQFINQNENSLKEVEQIEHFISEKTVYNIKKLMEVIQKNDFKIIWQSEISEQSDQEDLNFCKLFTKDDG